MSGVVVRRLSGFDDPAASPDAWRALLARSPRRSVFQTRAWLATWWEVFGRSRLLLLLAERAGRPVALAPLFADSGMAFPVGAGGSDYLDVIGDAVDPDVVRALLDAARAETPDFVGVRLYLLPDDSPTGAAVAAAAEALGLSLFDEGDLPAPFLDLAGRPDAAAAAPRKSSLVRHEKALAREGTLDVVHARDAADVAPHLDAFFAQHEARWSGTPWPSLFLDARWREFYRRLVPAAAEEGWLRFTRLTCGGRPAAFHFGACFEGVYLWYKPSFAPEFARCSPGEVLLRHLLLAAVAEGAVTFDFGLGDEAFKHRFATGVRRVRTWGIYPAGSAA